jgi:hypothetical protein
VDEPGVPTELQPRLLRGLDLFDAGAYHDAHEELEEAWAGEVGATRHLLQALIQLAVALHHRESGNRRGARALLERALEHLTAVPGPACFLDPRRLEREVAALREDLAQPDDPAGRAPAPSFAAARAAIREGRSARGLPPL